MYGSYFPQEVIDDQKRILSDQLGSVEVELLNDERAAVLMSEKLKHADSESSKIMAAMSGALHEYDSLVSANHETERESMQLEESLSSLRASYAKEISELENSREELTACNADIEGAIQADRDRVQALNESLVSAQETLAGAKTRLGEKQSFIDICKQKLQEEEAKKRQEQEELQKALAEACTAENEAQNRLKAAQARLQEHKVLI